MIFDEMKVQRFDNFVVDEVSRLRYMSRATTHADYDQANRRYSSSLSLLKPAKALYSRLCEIVFHENLRILADFRH